MAGNTRQGSAATAKSNSKPNTRKQSVDHLRAAEFCLACKDECLDPVAVQDCEPSISCYRCSKWCHFRCCNIVLPTGIHLNTDFLHFICRDCKPLVDKAVRGGECDQGPGVGAVAEVDAQLKTVSASLKQLVEEFKTFKSQSQASSPSITPANMSELAAQQQRQQNLVMSNIPINTRAPDGGIAEAEKFFVDTFDIKIGEQGLLEGVMPVGKPESKMVKLRFKDPFKRHQILRQAASKLTQLQATAPLGRKPTIRPDYSFQERQQRRELYDQIKSRPGGLDKFTIRNNTIVERAAAV